MQSCSALPFHRVVRVGGGLDIVGNVISQSGDNMGETYLTLLWIIVRGLPLSRYATCSVYFTPRKKVMMKAGGPCRIFFSDLG